MTQAELELYIQSKLGVPYNTDHPKTHSLETGFNCLSWTAHLCNLQGLAFDATKTDLTDLKQLRQFFDKMEPPASFMYVVCFDFVSVGRHSGVMLDSNRFTHVSGSSNGVSIGKLSSAPWKIIERNFYRHKSL